MWKNVVDIVLIDFVTTSTKSSSSSSSCNIFFEKIKKLKYIPMICFVGDEATLGRKRGLRTSR